MTTFQTVANEFYKAFKTTTRHDSDEGGRDTRVVILDDGLAPEWMRDALYEAHSDRLPDDWIYDSCRALVSAISEYESADEASDAAPEIVDSQIDIYSHDLGEWYAASGHNRSACDEALHEGLVDTDATIDQRIQMGQFVVLQHAIGALISAIEAEANRRDTEASETHVIVETMPDHLRESHRAAGNWGVYPVNGAVRITVARDDAQAIVDSDPDGYARIVSE